MRFERKKLIRNPVLIGFLVLLLLCNLLRIYRISRSGMSHTPQSYSDAEQTVYSRIRGAWNSENLRFISETYRKAAKAVEQGNYDTTPDQSGTYTGYIFGDYSLFGDFYDEMEYMYHYPAQMTKLLEAAEENQAFYQARGNMYGVRESCMIASKYSGRSISAYYRTKGAESLIRYSFSDLLILIAVLLIAVPVFAREHETDMYELLCTTFYGSFRLCVQKLTASLGLVFQFVLMISLSDLVGFVYWFQIDGLSLPLYAIRAFQNTPLCCSIGMFLVLMLAGRLLAAAVVTVICLLCSAVSSDSVTAFVLSVFAVFGMMLANGNWNPLLLMRLDTVTAVFDTVPVFGYPVLRCQALFAAMLLIYPFLVSLLMLSVRRTRRLNLRTLIQHGKERILS